LRELLGSPWSGILSWIPQVIALRIVSLLASATEIVCALGAGDYLVGRSHECDNPEWVRSLPACSEPAFDISVSSGNIDREVTRRLRAGEPLYIIHTERIRRLQPDLILAQTHCDVCAVTPGDVQRNGACIQGARIVGLSASSLEGIFDSIQQVAQVLGRKPQAEKLIARERDRLARLRLATASLPRPSAALLEWTDPIYPAGNWGPELVDAAGAWLVLGNSGQHSHAIPSDQLKQADPDYIVVAPCGFALDRARQEAATLARLPWWKDLKAVRSGKLAFADGNLFFNRSGMTAVRSAEILAEIFHGIASGRSTYGHHWVWAFGPP
jgi:iron complex transport system substrate-binding protein